MFPLLVDMTEEESWKVLRFLELEAYSGLVTALRAQGSLDSNKLKFIKEASTILHISEERFKSELKRVVLDERLNTVAYCASGNATTWEDWIQEGRSLIPPLRRACPQTAYMVLADEIAEEAMRNNEQLPMPACTERKRVSSLSQSPVNVINENHVNVQFRVPEIIKTEEVRKRKISASYSLDNSIPTSAPTSTAVSTPIHYYMSPPKISKIQHLYRQKTKTKIREEEEILMEQQELEENNYQRVSNLLNNQKYASFLSYHKQKKLPLSPQPSTCSSSNVNTLQNVNSSSPKTEETTEMIRKEVESYVLQNRPNVEQNNSISQPGCSNENEAPRNANDLKIQQNMNYLPSSTLTNNIPKSVKVSSVAPSLKTQSGQKLIIVSNAQNTSNSSTMQRSVTIPFVTNISNKFKIVSANTSPSKSNLQGTKNIDANTKSKIRHQIVPINSNRPGKKIISFSNIQAFTANSGIKMLPLGTKLITSRGSIVNSSVGPVYIMNSMDNNTETVTKSSVFSPVMSSSKTQSTTTTSETSASGCVASVEDDYTNKSTDKSVSDDIESQISQLTEIPQQMENSQNNEQNEIESANNLVQEEYVIEDNANDYQNENDELFRKEEIVHEDNVIHEGEIVHDEIYHEDDIVHNNEVVQENSEIIHENNYVHEYGLMEENEEVVHEMGEIIEDAVLSQEKYEDIEQNILNDNSEENYVISKNDDVNHYKEETIHYEENSDHNNSRIDFTELEIATESNCAKVQTNIC